MTPGPQADILSHLGQVLDRRRPHAGGDPGSSYTARLMAKGTDAVLKKIGEEATELVMAAKDGQADRIVAETADLWFHTLVALSHFGLKPQQVLDELRRREGTSGLDEFAQRGAPAKPSPQ